MKRSSRLKKTPVPVMLAALLVALLASAEPASAAKTPVGKTYFVVSLGLSSDPAEIYQPDVGCLQFTRTEVCDRDGDCGRWWRIEEERQPRQWGVRFEFDLIDDQTGQPIRLEGQGRVDARGPRSSIAAAAHGQDENSGVTINFALAGRAVSLARCEQLVADFEAARNAD